MRVLLVVNDSATRQAIVPVLRAIPGVTLLGEAANSTHAVVLSRAMRPDTIIMDIDLRPLDGVGAMRIIHGDHPVVRVIGLALDQPRWRVQAMLNAGAVACVGSPAALDTLVKALMRRDAAVHCARPQ